ARRPPDNRAIGTAAANAGVESPQQFAGGAVQRDGHVGRGHAVENAMDEDRLRLWIALAVPGVVSPGNLQARDVGAIDLLQRRVTNPRGTAAIPRPIRGSENANGEKGERNGSDHS